jgi:hypothetical protein
MVGVKGEIVSVPKALTSDPDGDDSWTLCCSCSVLISKYLVKSESNITFGNYLPNDIYCGLFSKLCISLCNWITTNLNYKERYIKCMADLDVVKKRNIHPPSWNQIPVVQPIASHFTDYTITVSHIIWKSWFKLTLWSSVTWSHVIW